MLVRYMIFVTKKKMKFASHGLVTEKGKFQCFLCSDEVITSTIFNTEIGIMAHMLYCHLISPSSVEIAGWTREMEKNLNEQIVRIDWDFETDVEFFLKDLEKNEGRIFRNGKASIVRIVIK